MSAGPERTASVDAAAAVLRRGGVVAYPTEAVYGLGCDPADDAAISRIFALKQRPSGLGLLIVAASLDQLDAFIDRAALPDAALGRAAATWPGPHTWIFPRAAAVAARLTGGHAGIAVRVTAHPVAAALCRAFGGAIVSTSANRHGDAPARSSDEVAAAFGDGVDLILNGALGGLERPTPIRDAISGEHVRT